MRGGGEVSAYVPMEPRPTPLPRRADITPEMGVPT